MKMLTLGLAALLATGPALADTHTADPVIHDKPGFFVHLDVAKELTSTNISQECGIVPAQFTYLDPRGASMCWITRPKVCGALVIIEPAL